MQACNVQSVQLCICICIEVESRRKKGSKHTLRVQQCWAICSIRLSIFNSNGTEWVWYTAFYTLILAHIFLNWEYLLVINIQDFYFLKILKIKKPKKKLKFEKENKNKKS